MALDVSQHPGMLLDTLWQEWERVQPRRAWGGRWALAGFSFQASIFLLRFFQAVEKGREEPGVLAEMERLSDVLCLADDKLVLTQVKSTLDRAQLISAVKEAYLLTDLCRRITPELLDSLRFQVACRRRVTPLVPHDLQMHEVISEGGDQDAWQAMQARFDADMPILVEADPLDRLHIFLWDGGLANPARLIRDSQGVLLRAFGADATQIQGVGRELADRYLSAERRSEWRAIGEVLSSADVAMDDAAPDRGVLTGQTPLLAHLRRGYFRERSTIFTPLWCELREWLAQQEDDGVTVRERIPVFWIGGRSGEGKSVLLLQAAAALLGADAGLPLIQLGAGEVPRLLEALPDRDHWLAAGNRDVAVVVDDLYNIQDREGWGERIREASDRTQPPVVLLTCGPTEQLEDFRHELGSRFAINDFPVPILTAEEARAFFDWYRTRTGKERDAALLRMDNPILVLLMFELAQGMEMAAFAERFQRRLERINLFAAARTIIAVNALYLRAPLSLVEGDEARDALERLCAEDQLHFEVTPPEPGAVEPGVRLLHPHLARYLLPFWIGDERTFPREWARELAHPLACWLRAGDTLAASVLIHKLLPGSKAADSGTALAVLSLQDRIVLIRELYARHARDEGGYPATATLPRWLELECKIPDLNLQLDPVAYAAELLRDDVQAVTLRGEMAAWVWRIARVRQNDQTDALVRIAQSFFLHFPANPGVGFSLATLLGQFRGDDTVQQFILEWLSANGALPEAYQLIAPLIAGNPTSEEVVTLARTWLANNREHPQVYRLIATLVAGNPTSEEVVALAQAWLAENKGHPQAYQVIAPLVKGNPTSEEVVGLAQTWLADNKDHPQAYHVTVIRHQNNTNRPF